MSPALPSEPLVIARLDGGRLVIHAGEIVRYFFSFDPSSVAVGSYDSLAGTTRADRIERQDVEALNRTMRARTPHAAWEQLLASQLPWLEAIPSNLDLIAASEDEWASCGGENLVDRAVSACLGPGRGVSVATKMLHLKRPRLFPVIDSLVVQMLGMTAFHEAPIPARVVKAHQLIIHLRTEGRRNLETLRLLQDRLNDEGKSRSLVRILDALLWLSHPAAGTGFRRSFEVTALS